MNELIRLIIKYLIEREVIEKMGIRERTTLEVDIIKYLNEKDPKLVKKHEKERKTAKEIDKKYIIVNSKTKLTKEVNLKSLTASIEWLKKDDKNNLKIPQTAKEIIKLITELNQPFKCDNRTWKQKQKKQESEK